MEREGVERERAERTFELRDKSGPYDFIFCIESFITTVKYVPVDFIVC